jgi:transcriptional regulator with XRE-family HTH domain
MESSGEPTPKARKKPKRKAKRKGKRAARSRVDNPAALAKIKHKLRRIRGDDSQEEAAEKSGIAQTMWSKLERGESTSTAQLHRIARAYSRRLEWLRDDQGDEFHTPTAEWDPAYGDPLSALQEAIPQLSPVSIQMLAFLADNLARRVLLEKDITLLANLANQIVIRH